MTLPELLRDAHARIIRALEAVQVGDVEFAVIALDDLAADVWKFIERERDAA